MHFVYIGPSSMFAGKTGFHSVLQSICLEVYSKSLDLFILLWGRGSPVRLTVKIAFSFTVKVGNSVVVTKLVIFAIIET